MPRDIDILIVGQTPPPYHGQAIMIDMLVRSPMEGVRKHHIRMNFSDSMDQVGRFQWRKVVHLFSLIVQIIGARIRHRPEILYYPPAGPKKVPLLRDIAILSATRWLFPKTVFHFQASGVSEYIESSPGWIKWFAKRALGNPDAAVELSEFTTRDGRYLNARQVYLIPNAAEDFSTQFPKPPQPESSAQTSSESHPCPGPIPSILYVGTVVESKGILVLLDACSELVKQNIPFRLDIVGSFQPASFENIVSQTIETLGLRESVTLHGQKIDAEKWEMFSRADLFCFPTYYESEGFPCVLVEAMAFSLPIISTSWRGIPSIVVDRVTGFLCQTKDRRSLADRLKELLEDPELRQRMGTAARLRYLELFSKPKHIEQMRAMLIEVAGQ